MVLLFQVRRLYQIRHPIFTASKCFYNTVTSKPLRILFCGSDEFSCASLRAVRQEQLENPQSIASIDVLVRPGKLSGRGLKSIREVPIKSVAQELGLAVHERDTFTGWSLPQPDGSLINLIIAVSFGLFVPPRILKAAEYGGINVHPSLLPDFRGPAPLQHTLLAGESRTGVTLQTLHPEKFDHGAILAQTPPHGLKIPNAPECTYQELLDFITPKAAEMLVRGIRDRLFIPDQKGDISSQGTQPLSIAETGRPLRPAPKITTEDRHINWNTMKTKEILQRDRVIGRLWNLSHPKGKSATRIIFGNLTDMNCIDPHFSWPGNVLKLIRKAEEMLTGNLNGQLDIEDPGNVFLLPLISPDNKRYSIPGLKHGDGIVLRCSDGGAILVNEITIEGRKKGPAKGLLEWARDGVIEPSMDPLNSMYHIAVHIEGEEKARGRLGKGKKDSPGGS